MIELDRRRAYTEELLANFKAHIQPARDLASEGQACVCATGSVGRGEAGKHSDLDLVIVTRGITKRPNIDAPEVETDESCLSLLNEIRLKANIIDAMKHLGLPDLDGEGKYFEKYTTVQLITSIGEQHDDWDNTLSSRLLLLLESTPLLGDEVHKEAIGKIIASYWSDYEGHESDYVPAFFTNDVLRLWRTFCVNYEARTRTLSVERRMERKIKNLKLKYSRMLTCYSSIIYLLNHYNTARSVPIEVGVEMALLTPIDRLLKIKEQAADGKIITSINEVLNRYDSFLSETDMPKPELVDYMRSNFDRMRVEAHNFGDQIFEAMLAASGNNRFYRMIVV